MYLSRLSVQGFRNLAEQVLEFPREGVAIIGDNAQGKSSLLEAIYFLETFRSFRGARDEQLVAFGAPLFRVAGTLSQPDAPQGSLEIAAAFQRVGKRKKVVVGGAEPERLGDALGRVGAVLFSPADTTLVAGPPPERRRYLDILLSLNAPGYLQELQRFRHALAQRNAALRTGGSPSLVRVWDTPLAEAGARVMEVRERWVQARAEAFGGYFRQISGEGSARMGYRASIPLPDRTDAEDGAPDRYRAAFHAALGEASERERRMGTTLVGPHRDELTLRMEGGGQERGLDLREYGSGGQRRTAALALRLVEADTIRDARGSEPLVLLDDAFAELDEGRSRRILELLDRPTGGQVILTAPREGDVRVRRDSLERWRIAGGIVSGGGA